MMLANYVTDVPPGFEGQPLVYMMTLFSLLMITLLTLEWFWRIAWGAYERPFGIKHPVTVLRVILLLVGISVLLRVGPDIFRFALWRTLSPQARFMAFEVDHWLDMFSFIPWSLAWLAGYLGMPMMHFQLEKRPPPIHLWPTKEQLKRPLKIGMAVLLIAAAITYYG
jgi:hypothetical protein